MKHFIKKILLGFLIINTIFFSNAFALNQEEAIKAYAQELENNNLDAETARKKAESDVESLIDNMESSQYDIDVALDNLEKRVSGLMTSDSRLNEAKNYLDSSKQIIRNFLDISPQNQIEIQESSAGALPRVLASEEFELAKIKAMDVINRANQILIAPSRPGEVPTGEVEDFISQFIRQLFRFAWVVVLLSLITSGIFFILAKGNDDRISKAKSMLIFSLIGFVVITLAFAIVNAITDIDFFSFI